jgi:mevalonate kinase
VDEVAAHPKRVINWTANYRGQPWFSATIKIPELKILKTSDPIVSKRLVTILKAMMNLKTGFLNGNSSLMIKTSLDFNPQWGMGSSSSLLANLSAWAEIDPWLLFSKVSVGSGYDVVAASMKDPFLFQRSGQAHSALRVTLSPSITSHLYFVYTGSKKKTDAAVEEYRKLPAPDARVLKRISVITTELAVTDDLKVFQELIEEHENILSNHLEFEPVKQKHFSDFRGSVKSLGAWGGDFLLFVDQGTPRDMHEYLMMKGLEVYYPYHELKID